MSPNTPSDDVVLVPVPTQYLPAVYQALAAAMGERPPAISAAAADGASLLPPAQRSPRMTKDGWTQTMVVRLNRVLHLDGARALLDALAKISPEELALPAAADIAGVSPQQMAGQLAGLTRRCKKEFDRLMGPYHVRYDEMGKAFYWMAEDVAIWWRGEPAAQ